MMFGEPADTVKVSKQVLRIKIQDTQIFRFADHLGCHLHYRAIVHHYLWEHIKRKVEKCILPRLMASNSEFVSVFKCILTKRQHRFGTSFHRDCRSVLNDVVVTQDVFIFEQYD